MPSRWRACASTPCSPSGRSHNALGPFDFTGAYDQASDRRQEFVELIDRGYDDAGRQFIEPVVGASGEYLAQADPGPHVLR